MKDYKKAFGEKKGLDLFAKQFAKFVHESHFKKPGKLLDVGFGSGHYIKGFDALSYEVSGVDGDPKWVSRAKKWGIDARRCNFESDKLPFKNNTFDYIFSKALIEHIREPHNLGLEMYRVLKKGGKAFIHTADWVKAWKLFWNSSWHKLGHKTPFTKLSLYKYLAACGFKNIEVYPFKNIPYIWRYSTIAFKLTDPRYQEIYAIGEKE